jgi:hypothetical protein
MMKKNLKWFVLAVIILTITLDGGLLNSQTPGTFTLSLYTTSTGGYSPRHVVAIWLENSNSTFVKTKLLQSSGSNLDHLALWTSRAGSNTVDATTGATLLTHGNITVVWNGTDITGAVVPDGSYNAWVEMAWASNLTTGKTYSIFPFTKGPVAFQSTPTNLTNFYSISLNWAPSTPTLVEKVPENNEASIYPNPTSGLLHMKFRNGHRYVQVRVYNESGIKVYSETLTEFTAGEKTLDVSHLPAGIYFVSFHFETGDESIRIVKTK